MVVACPEIDSIGKVVLIIFLLVIVVGSIRLLIRRLFPAGEDDKALGVRRQRVRVVGCVARDVGACVQSGR
eukprot:8070011-Heterocapsa_arctica.AAC.1